MRGPLILLVGCGIGQPTEPVVATPSPPPVVPEPGPPSIPAPRAQIELGHPVSCDAPEPRWTRLELGQSYANAELGFGLAVADFDGNGHLDLAAAAPNGIELFLQDAEGWTAAPNAFAGLDLSRMIGLSAADVDGDADLDLFATRHGEPNLLFLNLGDRFEPAPSPSNEPSRTSSASWGDVDGDGDLDLWVGNYGELVPDVWDPTVPVGDPSRLYLNRGDGTFTDASARLPSAIQDSHTFMTALYDLDEDGLPELFNVADFGWFRPSSLTWNDGQTLRPDEGAAFFHPDFAGMGLGVGDLNHDGIPDFVQSSYETLSLLESVRFGGRIEWAEHAQVRGLAVDLDQRQVFGWGTAVGDLDNDTDLDIVMGFGRWSEYLNPADQRDGIWRRDGDRFTPVGSTWGLDDGTRTRGVLLVDLDGNGALDLVRRPIGEPVTIDFGGCTQAHWASVRLADPFTPNSAAIGARVTAWIGTTPHTRWVEAGSSSMFSSGPPVLHFGLGAHEQIDALEVRWPDGAIDQLGSIPANRKVHIVRLAPP